MVSYSYASKLLLRTANHMFLQGTKCANLAPVIYLLDHGVGLRHTEYALHELMYLMMESTGQFLNSGMGWDLGTEWIRHLQLPTAQYDLMKF